MSVTFTLVPPVESAHEVNYSNANARRVFAALGLDAEYLAGESRCGPLTAACDRAIEAILADPKADRGRFGVISRGAMGCTVIDGGAEPGDLLRRVRTLRDLAAMGGDLGRVTWG